MSYKKLLLTLASAGSLFALSGCGNQADEVVRVGVIGEDHEDWEFVQDKVADQGVDLELVSFSDYSQPNRALDDGDIDLNAFQHRIFLDNFNEEFGTNIVPIADTVIAPLGIYSEEVQDVSEIGEGAEIAIPNDVTNGGRALVLLQSAGLLEVDPDAGILPTTDDITDNPLNLEITELDASQTARSIGDVTAAVINSGIAVDAGYSPEEDAVFLEPVDENSEPYINVIAANEGDERESFDIIVDAYQSEDTLEVINEASENSEIVVWAEEGYEFSE